ncbi:hypothetical protein CIK76_07145 [Glutamicibacter sp. BW80]|nr:hypothetical protein CIK76_07145 [Glutamicibacter sp. BW80]
MRGIHSSARIADAECLKLDKTCVIVQSEGVTAQHAFPAGPRARDGFILRMSMAGDWEVEVQDRCALTILAVRSGSCAVQRGETTIQAEPGNLVVIHGTAPYRVFADSARPRAAAVETYLIGPGQQCLGPAARPVTETLRHGVRSWGNARDGADQLLVCTFTTTSAITDLICEGRALCLIEDAALWNWVELLHLEAERQGPVQSLVLDRLLDILALQVLQQMPGAGMVPGAKPGISAAVGAMWSDPAEPWSVALLAGIAAMSRSAFSAAFHEAMGMPPVGYLTRLRLALAWDALQNTNSPLGQIAREVGYSSSFALSAAIRRVYSASPSEIRMLRRNG